MLKVYVDESGNLGTQGRYFAIGAFCTEDGKRVRNVIKKHCAHCLVPELKNRETSFPDRQALALKFKSADDHKIGYVCVDKTKIQSPRLRDDHNLLFNYTFSYLMREIVDSHNNQDIRIIVDNRNQKVSSINSLGDYIKIKAYTEWGFVHNIETIYTDSHMDRLVQAADFVAGNVLEHYKSGKSHIYGILKPDFSVRFPSAQFGI